jgi:carbon storage regulator CsrA
MLFLTRRAKETQDTLILTDQDTGTVVTVVIRKVDGGQVRVGIEAPKHINVVRGELVGGN